MLDDMGLGFVINEVSRGQMTKWDAKEVINDYIRELAIDFHDWQKKDQAECLADMSTEDYFDKYLKSKQ